MIAAIETHYAGYRFRSRLEARWAVFFDALGIAWQYEPQGFDSSENWALCGGLERPVQYLPDFFLPSPYGRHHGLWVEVKGSVEALRNDAPRYYSMLDYSSPLPGIVNSECEGWGASGWVLLGDIPRDRGFGIFVHPIVQHNKGLWHHWLVFFKGGGWSVIHADEIAQLHGLYSGHSYDPNSFLEQVLTAGLDARFLKTPRAYPDTLSAYNAARQARFEHGERGRAA